MFFFFFFFFFCFCFFHFFNFQSHRVVPKLMFMRVVKIINFNFVRRKWTNWFVVAVLETSGTTLYSFNSKYKLKRAFALLLLARLYEKKNRELLLSLSRRRLRLRGRHASKLYVKM